MFIRARNIVIGTRERSITAIRIQVNNKVLIVGPGSTSRKSVIHWL